MNHAKIMLAITAIVVAAALATAGFAIPQQAMAGGHHNRHHNSHHSHIHNSGGIKVDQQINQQNQCNGQQPEQMDNAAAAAAAAANATQALVSNPPGAGAPCLNVGSNSAHIGH